MGTLLHERFLFWFLRIVVVALPLNIIRWQSVHAYNVHIARWQSVAIIANPRECGMLDLFICLSSIFWICRWDEKFHTSTQKNTHTCKYAEGVRCIDADSIFERRTFVRFWTLICTIAERNCQSELHLEDLKLICFRVWFIHSFVQRRFDSVSLWHRYWSTSSMGIFK